MKIFTDAIAADRIALPKGTRADLYGRIEAVFEAGRLQAKDRDLLHVARRRRRGLAHESDAVTTWETLEEDINSIEAGLQALGIVGARPTLEYFGERSAMQASTEPGIAFERTFIVGVKEDGRPAIEFSWGEKVHNVSASQVGGSIEASE